MNEELLPCPFCGGRAEIRGPLSKRDPLDQVFGAFCPSCSAPFHSAVRFGPFVSRSDAVERWNRRAPVGCDHLDGPYRKLSEERDALKAEVAKWRVGFNCGPEHIADTRLEAERAEANRLRFALSSSQARVERLVEALRKVRTECAIGYPPNVTNAYLLANEALAAHEGGEKP